MNNTSTNSTGPILSNINVEEYIASSGIMIFLVVVTLFLNITVVLGLCAQKNLYNTIQIVLVSISVNAIMSATVVLCHHLQVLILIGNPQLKLIDSVCRFFLWIQGITVSSSIAFMIVFSLLVLHLIVRKTQDKLITNKKIGSLIVISVWIVFLTISSAVWSERFVGIQHTGVTCSIVNKGLPTFITLFLYIIFIAVIPTSLSLLVPIIALCYLKTHLALQNVAIKKSMAKFTLLLVIFNLVHVFIVMPSVLYRGSQSEDSIESSRLTIDLLTTVPPIITFIIQPLLMIIFFKTLRLQILQMFRRLFRIEKSATPVIAVQYKTHEQSVSQL